jgi:phosphatidylinositol-3,4,5-trisphosphate 3-phosphatase/dual-specificity protein phosphatase PTEN
VGVRQADDEVDRPLTLCVFWPEDPQATFYLQAHNAAARDDWLAKLRAASAVTLESLAELGMAELKQRVVACGLVNPSDFTRERQQLQQLFLTHVASRPADYHNTIATGLAKTVLSRSMAKSSLLSTALGMVRGAVSLNKTRFQQDGFDLDLTYITPRRSAMAYPSAGLEGYYRNDVEQVQRFFGTYHPGYHYRVFNLCEERVYPPITLGGEMHADCVLHWPFDDHNPPVLDMIHPLCVTMKEWLDRHPDNVAAVHCKAGKGRTAGAARRPRQLHRGARELVGELRSCPDEAAAAPHRAAVFGRSQAGGDQEKLGMELRHT